jgi:hypothetical protein
VDERAIGVGVSVMVATALTALWHSAPAAEPPARGHLAGAAEGER